MAIDGGSGAGNFNYVSPTYTYLPDGVADTGTTTNKITLDELQKVIWRDPDQKVRDAVREAMETYLRDEGIIAPHEAVAKQKDINEELRRQIKTERELHRSEMVDQQTKTHMLEEKVVELEVSLDLATKALAKALEASEAGVALSLQEVMDGLTKEAKPGMSENPYITVDALRSAMDAAGDSSEQFSKAFISPPPPASKDHHWTYGTNWTTQGI